MPAYAELLAALEKLHSDVKSTKGRFLASHCVRALKKHCDDLPRGSTSGGAAATSPVIDPTVVNEICFSVRELIVENSQPKAMSKLLVSTLDTTAVLLSSGFVPVNLWLPPPTIDIPSHAPGVAQEFFSRLLGGSGMSAASVQVPSSFSGAPVGCTMPKCDTGEVASSALITPHQLHSSPPTPVAEQKMDSGGCESRGLSHTLSADSACAPFSSGQCSASRAANVYISVVDAVLATMPYVQSKDGNERLRASFLGCLQASVAPRFVVEYLPETGVGDVRTQALAVHGERLEQIVSIFFATLTRGSATLALVEEARTILNVVAKALTRAVEHEVPSATTEVTVRHDGRDVASTVCQRDMMCFMEKCASVAAALACEGDGAAVGGTVVSQSVTGNLPSTLVPPQLPIQATLALILQVIVNGGPAFRKGLSITKAIKHSVFPSVLRTALTNDLDIFRLSLNILLSVSIGFSGELVHETSTFFNNVLFRLLQAKHTSVSQKCLVVEAFRRYIEEPQNLLSLFLNYDCNTNSQSIYELMIAHLSALANPRVASPSVLGKGADDAVTSTPPVIPGLQSVPIPYAVPPELQRSALLTLLLVADSNVQWIERFEFDQSLPANNVGVPTDGTALEEGIQRATTSAGSDSQLAQPYEGDLFAVRRRMKDELRNFLHLFNEDRLPQKAVEFLMQHTMLLASLKEDLGPNDGEPQSETLPTGPCNHSEKLPVSDLSNDGGTGVTRPRGCSGDDGPDPEFVAQANAEALTSTDAVDRSKEKSFGSALPSRADLVALFLKRNEDWLDKLVLGEYFAKSLRKQEAREVFEQWIALHNFSGLTLDAALREFLGGFKIVGEAQIVDKTMELFAAHYCRQNPHVFSSADTAFILSFSICMLNTDAHSMHVKEKMSLEGFIRNNAGIDEGKDIDRDVLVGIYSRISSDEIKLRPSLNLRRNDVQEVADDEVRSHNLVSGLLESIPIFRHLIPLANTITDTVMIPVDAAGNALFNTAQRKREESHRVEFRAILKDAVDALQSSASTKTRFVQATTIENAIPMWGITVNAIVIALDSAIAACCELADAVDLGTNFPAGLSNSSPTPATGAGASSAGATSSSAGAVQPLLRDDAENQELLLALSTGATKTIRVCCAFGTLSQAEEIVEILLRESHCMQCIQVQAKPARIRAMEVISKTRLTLLKTLFNAYVTMGSMFTSRMWYTAYTAVSLLDALANGFEGIWERQKRKVIGAPRPQAASVEAGIGAEGAPELNRRRRVPRPSGQSKDIWFGDLEDVPTGIDSQSNRIRLQILQWTREMGSVDWWLERLFDATAYPTHAQLQMAYGLVLVCQKELDSSRTFSLTKLLESVTVCASCSSRLQWRSLWASASEVLTRAGTMSPPVARLSLGGLRIIALSYLMREELTNYSFQKEVLRPFETILMRSGDPDVRLTVIEILGEIVDFRASHLASGWNVVLSCLSHSALMPPIVASAWRVCLRIVSEHISHTKDCFREVVYCLTSFACNPVNESVAFLSTSYLLACGHWLQFGLERPPSEDAEDSQAIILWAQRFGDAEREAQAHAHLGADYIRISLSPAPLTTECPLEKPTDFAKLGEYHLWSALLEGMIPIIVIHRSVRVRCFVICALWEIIRFYGPVFGTATQNSIFSSVLRPALKTLSTDTFTLAPDDAAFDQMDYRILLYLFLRSMFVACTGSLHLMELACETLEAMSGFRLSLSLIQVGFIDSILRSCFTLSPPLVASLASPPAGGDGEPVQWVGGLVHEMQQIGNINVVKLKRTAGWSELHLFEELERRRSRPLCPPFSPPIDARLSRQRATAQNCIVNGIVPRLQALLSECSTISDVLVVVHSLRKAFSVLAGCSGAEGVDLLINFIADLQQQQQQPDCSIPPEAHILQAYLFVLLEFVFHISGTNPIPGEGVWLRIKEQIKQLVDGMHAARAFCVASQVSAVDEYQRHDARSRGGQAVVRRRVKGRSFQDVFRACRAGVDQRNRIERSISPVHASEMAANASNMPVSAASAHPNLPPSERTTMEWVYLCRLLTLKLLLAINKKLTALFDVEDWREVALAAPSELEETSAIVFVSSCWNELQLHLQISTEPIMASLLSHLMQCITTNKQDPLLSVSETSP